MGLRLKSLLTAATLALAVASSPALSQDEGWYIGAGAGGTKFRTACDGFTGPGSCDDNGFYWKVFGGYQFNRYFGFELGYMDFGKAERQTTGVGTDTFEATGFDVNFVVTVPVTQGFAFFGKIGTYRWDVDRVITGTGAATSDATGTDMTYGLGARYNVSQSISVRAEWQRYFSMGDAFTGGFDVDAYLLGIAIKF
jgi:OOP family OmpA-OmpF porin